ncbi:hypothetical protein [Enterococcus casseliflavus]
MEYNVTRQSVYRIKENSMVNIDKMSMLFLFTYFLKYCSNFHQ